MTKSPPPNAPRQYKGARLGTRIRGAMAESYDARGHKAQDLHLHYSQKMGRDVVLAGRLRYIHFLMVEGDPLVNTVDYTPHAAVTALAGDAFADLVAAQVTMTNGEVVWRRLIYTEPDTSAFVEDLRNAVGKGPLSTIQRLEVLTFNQLVARDVWTRNVHRALSWIAAAREWPLGQYKHGVLDLLQKHRQVAFQRFLELGEGGNSALVGAAVLQLALNGAIETDLATLPLSRTSLFSAVRGER